MPEVPTVSIVGCGRAGGSIGLALRAAGYPLVAAWSRSAAGRRRAERLLGVWVPEDVADAVSHAGVTIVAVPDDVIGEVASAMRPGVRDGDVVVHTSGSVSVEALVCLREAGARVGSMHPLQTLTDPVSGAAALRGAGVAVTCDAADRPLLEGLAAGWGGRPFALDDDAKAVYHAAAVFASNHLVACLWAADALLKAAGAARAAVLGPLARTAVDNALAAGAAAAITGPVARGDTGVLRRHVAALGALGNDGSVILEAYRALSMACARLAASDEAAVREALA